MWIQRVSESVRALAYAPDSQTLYTVEGDRVRAWDLASRRSKVLLRLRDHGIGAVYDLFGTGGTALKMSLGKYLEGASFSGNYGLTNPSTRMPTTTQVSGAPGVTRAWTDANGNFVTDCDLLNPAAQDLRPGGGDVCGVISNTSFGKEILTNNFDPAILGGWGVRPSDWSLAVSLQHQIGSQSAVDVTYSRRWFRGFSVVDNRSLQPSDLTAPPA